jgi:hypothetical protein
MDPITFEGLAVCQPVALDSAMVEQHWTLCDCCAVTALILGSQLPIAGLSCSFAMSPVRTT